MPDQELIGALATGDLIQQVDSTRSDYDLFKLSQPLAGLVATRLDEARGANAAGSRGAGIEEVKKSWRLFRHSTDCS